MHFPISAATAAAIFAILVDETSAHCRFIHTTGDKGGDGRGLLSTWTHHGKNDVVGQKEATIFSDPPVPNPKVQRLYLNEGCGMTLQTVDLWWKMFGGKNPEDGWKYQETLSNRPGITKEAWVQTWWETLKQSDGEVLPVVSADGTGWLHMAVLQINEDGAGPFRCRVDPNGDGKYPWGWEPDSRYSAQPQPNDGGAAKSFWPAGKHKAHLLKWHAPKGLVCNGKSGKYSNVCIMRCENYATNGPFGGCIPFRTVNQPPEIRRRPPKPIDKPVEHPEVIDYEDKSKPVQAADGGYYKRDLHVIDADKIQTRSEHEGIIDTNEKRSEEPEKRSMGQMREQKRNEEMANHQFLKIKRSVRKALKMARRMAAAEPPHVMSQAEE
ncbi:hypothetical protein TWF730_009085 [Orbilia blumenaviensis]|uniref:Uncharacterized protein n=1 Tax=Orbilia blumenaviensis TaxID=1796055 RepID=A0AAV9V0J4_9PEZI